MEHLRHLGNIKFGIRKFILHQLIKFPHEGIVLRRQRIVFQALHCSGFGQDVTYPFPVRKLRLDKSKEILRFERFGDISVCPTSKSLDLIFDRSLCCKEYDRNMGNLNVVFYLTAKFVSRLAGHHNI